MVGIAEDDAARLIAAGKTADLMDRVYANFAKYKVRRRRAVSRRVQFPLGVGWVWGWGVNGTAGLAEGFVPGCVRAGVRAQVSGWRVCSQLRETAPTSSNASTQTLLNTKCAGGGSFSQGSGSVGGFGWAWGDDGKAGFRAVANARVSGLRVSRLRETGPTSWTACMQILPSTRWVAMRFHDSAATGQVYGRGFLQWRRAGRAPAWKGPLTSHHVTSHRISSHLTASYHMHVSTHRRRTPRIWSWWVAPPKWGSSWTPRSRRHSGERRA